jgi:Type IV pili methyl-accepting chemotaxis transducer N-term
MHRRQFVQWACASSALAVATTPAWSLTDTRDLADAINKAGRQRMLSQRMAKAWLAVGQQVEAGKSERILGGSMAQFEQQLGELKRFAPSTPIAQTYGKLEAAWADYKAVLSKQAPDRGHALDLLAAEGRVLQLAHQGTGELEAFYGRPLGRLVNLSGRQRMLSQRSAKYYLARRWNVEPGTAVAEMNKARGEFNAALKVLQGAPQTTARIKGELQLVSQQWVFFEHALERRTQAMELPQHATDVLLSSEHILSQMDEITSLYARLV